MQEDGTLYKVCWSSDGRSVACSTQYGDILVVDALTHTLLARNEDQKREIKCLAWSPDNQQIVAGFGAGSIFIWDLPSNTEKITYLYGTGNEEDDNIFECCWSPDGHVVALTGYEYNASLQLRDAHSGERISTFFPREPFDAIQAQIEAGGREGYQPPFASLSWSPSGKKIAFAQEYKLHIWNPLSDELDISIQPFFHLPQPGPLGFHTIQAIAWSPDEMRLAIACENEMVIWHIANQHREVLYQQHTREIKDVHWLPDGQTILSVDASSAHLWNSRNGACRGKTDFGDRKDQIILNAAISPDRQEIAFVGKRTQKSGNVRGVLWLGQHKLFS